MWERLKNIGMGILIIFCVIFFLVFIFYFLPAIGDAWNSSIVDTSIDL